MRQEVTEAAIWVGGDMTRTFYQAAEKFGIKSNEMNQLYSEYARVKADAKNASA